MIVSSIPIINNSNQFKDRIALSDSNTEYTYQQLLGDVLKACHILLQDKHDLEEKPVAYLVPSSYTYVVWQWAIWASGGIAVPLCVSHPPKEWEYVLEDTGCEQIIFHNKFKDQLTPLFNQNKCQWIKATDYQTAQASKTVPQFALERRAMIIYTSGTTGKPKGVVTTHANINAQITALSTAWQWTEDDFILNFLPLHHVHGVINILSCALYSGAHCAMVPRFNAELVWEALLHKKPTLLMAVPTIYHKLIQHYKKVSNDQQTAYSKAANQLRLMVSGSAALPVPVLEEWQQITGHVLLERYGMTEIGMGLSNSYSGARIPGFVGKPLPGVQTIVVQEDETLAATGELGELRIKGPTVFLEYWKRPTATADAFKDGWFCTGDIVLVNEEGNYKIVGRNSVDIIKTGGFKVSALEIEEVLLSHPLINECAVVGIEDEEWGERVALASVTEGGQELTVPEIKAWGADKLAPYKLPSMVCVVNELPRNAMGKVMKKKVVLLF